MLHSYSIVFNKDVNKKTGESYQFGKTRNICVFIQKQRAKISFNMSVLHTIDDIISFKVSLVRDAYIKVHLLHALRYDEKLNVLNILVTVDGETTELSQKSDPNFPYMYPMLGSGKLGAEVAWSTMERDILQSNKTTMKNDLRYAALFSYLSSKKRDYEIDRFSNLWTSMNALYNYIGSLYEENCRGKAYKLKGVDSVSIGALTWLVNQKYGFKSRGDYGDLWKKNFILENILGKYSPVEIERLYEESYQVMKGLKSVPEMNPLYMRAAEFGQDLYTLLLLGYPYNWRCKFFHGDIPTLLFSAYNDYEVAVLKVVNYFMDRYLTETIPGLFSDDFWTDEKQELIEEFVEKYKQGNGKK